MLFDIILWSGLDDRKVLIVQDLDDFDNIMITVQC